MAKLLPFPMRRVHLTAQSVRRLGRFRASRKRLGKPDAWANRPAPPEALGNMLQRLALVEPETVLVIESVVADILAQIGL